jgi:phage recombination protein Bet
VRTHPTISSRLSAELSRPARIGSPGKAKAPFQAYLVKYGADATMIVGKEAFTRKAEQNAMFDGFKAGVIVENGNEELEEREGTFIKSGEKLLGGWAEVFRKDRSMPFKITVSLQEYNTNQSLWRTKPGTMIRKVALVQCLRECFPSEFSGMYDSAEIGEEVVSSF